MAAEPVQSAERLRVKEHWRLASKIAISLVGFFAAFGITRFVPTGQQTDLLWGTGASLFVAGIVFIAQYLFEVERRLGTWNRKFDDHVVRTRERLDEHALTTERQMAEGLSKIHLATELFDLREKSEVQSGEMQQMIKLVRGFSRIASDAPPLVREFARSEITRLSDYLKQLGDGGDLTYDGEDRDWLLGLTKVATKSLQATSLSTVDAGGRSFTDGGLWRSELGQKYLDEQALAIKQGVRIQRIFIIDRQGLALEDLHEVLEPHVRIGVEVRTLDAIPRAGIHSRLRDFIVFDEVLSYQATPGQQITGLRPIIVSTSLVIDPRRVRDRMREFDQLWRHEKVCVVTLGPKNELVFAPPERSGPGSPPGGAGEHVLDPVDDG